jgi:2'-5' RNA ligase
VRLFVGIPLAESVKTELSKLVERFRSIAGFRWSAPASWHITLQFLGNTTEDQYRQLVSKLGKIRSAPVPIRLGRLGIFERAGILYAEVGETPELTALQRRVMAAAATCGFEPELRPFNPHITLARGKGPDRVRELRTLLARAPSDPKFARFSAAEFLLYESRLSPAGSEYQVRQRFPLETGS